MQHSIAHWKFWEMLNDCRAYTGGFDLKKRAGRQNDQMTLLDLLTSFHKQLPLRLAGVRPARPDG